MSDIRGNISLLQTTIYAEVLSITNREQEVLNLYVQGLTSKELASSLLISPNTVEAHKNKNDA